MIIIFKICFQSIILLNNNFLFYKLIESILGEIIWRYKSIIINIKYLKIENQQMGNLCQVQTDDPTVYNNGERPISSTMRTSLI